MTQAQWVKFTKIQAKQKHRGDPLDEAEQDEYAALLAITALKWPDDWRSVMTGPLWSPQNKARGHVIIGKESARGTMTGIANNELCGVITWR